MTDDDDRPVAPIHPLTIVPFEFEDSREPSIRACRHWSTTFVIDSAERSCTCKSCGAEVDPYVAIEKIANHWERWRASIPVLEAKAKAARERLADLERQEQNARARLARLRRQHDATA